MKKVYAVRFKNYRYIGEPQFTCNVSASGLIQAVKKANNIYKKYKTQARGSVPVAVELLCEVDE